jgi:hypothetical protein
MAQIIKGKYSLFIRATFIFFAVFTILAVGWLYFCNRYSVLSFGEERQLFRMDKFYFYQYITQPGGLTLYISVFLTQFYCFFLIGSIILSFSINAIYLLFMSIGRKDGDIDRFFLFPFIIPVCILLSCADFRQFGLWYIWGIALTLVLFRFYLTIRKSDKRFRMGILLYLLAYFITGGNAIILLALVVIDELFHEKRSFFYLIGMIALAFATPYIAHLFIYITPLKTAYFSLTPFDYPGVPNAAYRFAWLSIPILYAIWRIIARKHPVAQFKKPWIWIGIYGCILFSLSVWGMSKQTNPEQEKIMRMAYNTEQGNWDAVLRDGIKEAVFEWNAVPMAYFSNIALSEKGLLASKMFTIKQTGPYGMFLAWEPDYRIYLYIGELYYRMGIIQEAEHCAFEASITNYGAKAMRRLVYTTMLLRDTNGFEKYIRLFDKSPVYHHWAKKQREHYQHFLADSSYVIPGLPTALTIHSFTMKYENPESNLRSLLETNPCNQKVFENLVVYYLLRKNLNSFFEVMEQYYQGMNYEVIPRHIEEGLLLYAFTMQNQEYIMNKYTIRKETIGRYLLFRKDADSLSDKKLKAQYGDTYCYYFLSIKPLMLNEVYNSVY